MSDTDVQKLAKLLAGAQRAGYISIALPQCSGPADIQEVCDGLPALLRELSALRQRVGELDRSLAGVQRVAKGCLNCEVGRDDELKRYCDACARGVANVTRRFLLDLAAARQAGEGR